jgi:D-serine deaminase-like pyridoxal phosphate-dependent protein
MLRDMGTLPALEGVNTDRALASLATPVVVVDAVRFARNLKRMQDKADCHGVRLRPHIKTHKSVEFARMQLDLGAVGVTASKPSEALCFAEAGIESITLAFPIVEAGRLNALLEATRTKDLRMIADSAVGVKAVASAAATHHKRLAVYLKVDVGLGRVGVLPDAPRALDLARLIDSSDWLEFRGLLSHAGHAYGARNADEIRAVARGERQMLERLAHRLRESGLPVPEISVGCTPTALACDEELDGLGEIRPGNYVFLDRMAVNQGIAQWDDLALCVHATVVSVNDNHAIVDAGSKVLSSDGGPHGSQAMRGFGAAFPAAGPLAGPLVVDRLSEEHGFVSLVGDQQSSLSGQHRPRIGDRLRIYPNHSCPVANLADSLALVDEQSGSIRWVAVDARGLVR